MSERGFFRDVATGAVSGTLGTVVGTLLVGAFAIVAALVARIASPVLPSLLTAALVAVFVVVAFLLGRWSGDRRRRRLNANALPAYFDATMAHHRDVLGSPGHAVLVTVGHRGRVVHAHWTAKDVLALQIPVVIGNRWSIEFKLDRVIGEVNFNASWELDGLPPYMKKEPVPPQTDKGLMFDYSWRITDAQNEVLGVSATEQVFTVLTVTPHVYLALDGQEFQVDGGSQIEVLIPPNPDLSSAPVAFPTLSVAPGNPRTRRGGLFH